jgi:hypothetical protein
MNSEQMRKNTSLKWDDITDRTATVYSFSEVEEG